MHHVWKLAVTSKATVVVDIKEMISKNIERGFKRRKCSAEEIMEATKEIPHQKRDGLGGTCRAAWDARINLARAQRAWFVLAHIPTKATPH